MTVTANKSPEPTAVGAFPPSLRYGATSSSAVAVHVAGPAWDLEPARHDGGMLFFPIPYLSCA
jgi:hypothetical protein